MSEAKVEKIKVERPLLSRSNSLMLSTDTRKRPIRFLYAIFKTLTIDTHWHIYSGLILFNRR